MGNAISPCFNTRNSESSSTKLIFFEGTTKILTGKHIAGEVMFENPDMMVCHADSFFIGHPVPSLAIDDELKQGQTYFVLPIDRFACKVFTAASLAALTSSPKQVPISSGDSPFEYVKGTNGRVSIRVLPEFIIRLINRGQEGNGSDTNGNDSFLCSTPELKKHYEQLVGSREQTWSPKLETISEHKIRYSPCKFLGLEWKEKENDFS
ncbi:hypothetical protein JCGZ_22802 [Jatropha curcas]|uniref:DUF4228 domain-containing protein n=1 Tax=Jatropha curcas TaxID=180498 RepID=A0A067LFJ1_JATCU|nr:uncharacterized protein LOC105629029 [Jatropha curcas]KDP43250.1 hypothetical protein JCGZ_22802 [Jatropha curcas]